MARHANDSFFLRGLAAFIFSISVVSHAQIVEQYDSVTIIPPTVGSIEIGNSATTGVADTCSSVNLAGCLVNAATFSNDPPLSPTQVQLKFVADPAFNQSFVEWRYVENPGSVASISDVSGFLTLTTNPFAYTFGVNSGSNTLGVEAIYTLDSDGDGVVDADDLCPSTPDPIYLPFSADPVNPTIDASGCPLVYVEIIGKLNPDSSPIKNDASLFVDASATTELVVFDGVFSGVFRQGATVSITTLESSGQYTIANWQSVGCNEGNVSATCSFVVPYPDEFGIVSLSADFSANPDYENEEPFSFGPAVATTSLGNIATADVYIFDQEDDNLSASITSNDPALQSAFSVMSGIDSGSGGIGNSIFQITYDSNSLPTETTAPEGIVTATLEITETIGIGQPGGQRTISVPVVISVNPAGVTSWPLFTSSGFDRRYVEASATLTGTLKPPSSSTGTELYALVQQPELGVASITDSSLGSFTYTAPDIFSQSEYLIYSVTDDNGTSLSFERVTVVPLDPDSAFLEDSDGDFISTQTELLYGYDPFDPNDVLNSESFTPLDSDGDGYNDIVEMNSGSDPLFPGDMPAAGVLEFTTGNIGVEEGNRSLEVKVHRVLGAAGSISVDYADVPLAYTTASDYTLVPGTLAWADGEIGTKSFTVNLLDDSLIEGDEVGRLRLSNPQGGAHLGLSESVFTMFDTELESNASAGARPGEVGITSYAQRVGEAAGFIDIEVSRVRGSDGPVSVDVLVGDTTNNLFDALATADEDYAAFTQTVSWMDGEAGTKTVRVPIYNDTSAESTEYIGVSLQNPSEGLSINDFQGSEILIIDDDTRVDAGLIGFDSKSFRAEESEGQVDITVSRRYGSAGSVSVDIDMFDQNSGVYGHAVNGVDFNWSGPQTLTWADGEDGPKTVSVTIIDDAEYRGYEFFNAVLTNVTGGAALDRQAPFNTAESWATVLVLDPSDIDVTLDSDADGDPDVTDQDNDNDGVLNLLDAFSLDPAASVDTDGDGAPNDWNAGATQEQIDASSLLLDPYPDDITVSISIDPFSLDELGSGVIQYADIDSSGNCTAMDAPCILNYRISDTVVLNALPDIGSVFSAWFNEAESGICHNSTELSCTFNAADIGEAGLTLSADFVSEPDSDGDGVTDSLDEFPNDPTETTDTDGDRVGDNADPDPNDPSVPGDIDGDGLFGHVDADDDGDGIPDFFELNFGLDPDLASDASSDSDADSFSNFQEFQAGTDPTDETDFPIGSDLRRTHLFAPSFPLDYAGSVGFGDVMDADGDFVATVAPDGSVYIFQYDPTAGWVLDDTLMPGIGYLTAVALDNDVLAVSNESFMVSGVEAGAVQIYRRDGNGVWQKEVLLTAPTPEDQADFGSAIAIDGNTLAIAEDGRDNGLTGAGGGAVYVYTYDGSAWSMPQQMLFDSINSPDPVYSFGRTLALDGQRLVAGASFMSNGGDVVHAPVFVFDSTDGITWPSIPSAVVQPEDLSATITGYADGFGTSIAVEGDRMLVGAPEAEKFDLSNLNPRGAVYVFDYNGTVWTQVQRLMPSQITNFDEFGFSVAIEGNIAAVGSPEYAVGEGSVFLFSLDESGLSTLAELPAKSSAGVKRFGEIVLLERGSLFVGTSPVYLSEGDTGYDRERLEVFELDSDRDAITDFFDDYPSDPAASKDSDGDGLPDDWNSGYTQSDINPSLVVDLDDDNDGRLDVDDAFDTDPYEWVDQDSDGIGGNADFDDTDPSIQILSFTDAVNGNGSTIGAISAELLVCLQDNLSVTPDMADQVEDLYCEGLTSLSGLERFPNLRYLYLYQGAVDNLDVLGRLTRLLEFGTYEIDLGSKLGVFNSSYWPDLAGLYLDNSGLVESDLDDLSGLVGLRSLGLGNYSESLRNQFISVSALAPLSKLEELYLNDVGVSSITGLGGFTELVTAEITQSPISSLTEVQNWTKLESADFSDLALSDLSFLSDLQNLQTLDVGNYTEKGGNALSSLADLANLGSLSRLYVASTGLTSVADLGVTVAGQIERLDLSANAISDPEFLGNFTAMWSLGIENAGLTDLNFLSGLTSLRSLYASNDAQAWGVSNKNRFFDLTPLQYLSSLQSLYLADTQISSVQPLAGLTLLSSVDLSRNNITDVSPLAGQGGSSLNLARNEIKDVSSLTGSMYRLNLSGNQINSLGELPSNHALLQARDIDLSGNQLTNIDALAGASVNYLKVRANRLQNVDVIESMLFLRELIVPNNAIGDLPAGSLLSSLSGSNSVVDVSDNNITTVSTSLTTMDTGTLWLVGNPIACTEYTHLTVDRPNLVTGLPLASLTAFEVVCESDTDGDGIADVDDAYPNDIAASVDTDGDGLPDDWNSGYTSSSINPSLVVDHDDDNDGYLDTEDAFRTDNTEWADADGDGIGDNKDPGFGDVGFPTVASALSAISDPGLYACLVAQLDGSSTVDKVTDISCSDDTAPLIASLSGLSSFPYLERLQIFQSVPTTLDLQALFSLKQLKKLAIVAPIASLEPISGLVNLKQLDLILPTGTSVSLTPLSTLTRVEELYLQGASFASSDLVNFNHMVDLKALSLVDNGLGDIDSLDFSLMGQKLTELNISSNPISSITSNATFTSMTGLEKFIADDTNLTGLGDSSVSSGLFCCNRLRHVSLRRTFVDETSLSAIASSSLVYLDVSGSSVASISALLSMNNLISLGVADLGLTDLSPVTSLASLEYLSAANNNLTILPDLSALTQLHSLLLQNNQISRVGDKGALGDGVSTLPSNLEFLNLSNNNLSDLSGLDDLLSVGIEDPLSYLLLGNNQLTDVSALDGFDGYVLDLSGNAITSALPALRDMQSGLINLMGTSLSCSEQSLLSSSAPSSILLLLPMSGCSSPFSLFSGFDL